MTNHGYSAILQGVCKYRKDRTMRTGYQYSRYLGADVVNPGLRMPRKLYEKAQKDCASKRQSFNKRIVELMEQEFGSVDEETVVTEG